ARGYLRNIAQEKDPAIVRRLEHASFTTGIDDAFEALKKKKALTYSSVLGTHKILFEAMYPWAGQDRTQTAPNIAVSRGSVLFAHPKYIPPPRQRLDIYDVSIPQENVSPLALDAKIKIVKFLPI